MRSLVSAASYFRSICISIDIAACRFKYLNFQFRKFFFEYILEFLLSLINHTELHLALKLKNKCLFYENKCTLSVSVSLYPSFASAKKESKKSYCQNIL